MLVIDGTKSMDFVMDDVKARMTRLAIRVRQLVPIARIGVVVFGGKGEPLDMQPLTLSTAKLQTFLGSIQAKGGGEWQENTLGAVQAAVTKMDWKRSDVRRRWLFAVYLDPECAHIAHVLLILHIDAAQRAVVASEVLDERKQWREILLLRRGIAYQHDHFARIRLPIHFGDRGLDRAEGVLLPFAAALGLNRAEVVCSFAVESVSGCISRGSPLPPNTTTPMRAIGTSWRTLMASRVIRVFTSSITKSIDLVPSITSTMSSPL